jgi:hypothetical protein
MLCDAIPEPCSFHSSASPLPIYPLLPIRQSLPLRPNRIFSHRFSPRSHFSIPNWWPGGQSCRLQIQRSRGRFLPLSDFLISSEIGKESTQPHEIIESQIEWKAADPAWKYKTDLGGPSRWPCDTFLRAKIGTNLADRRRHSSFSE